MYLGKLLESDNTVIIQNDQLYQKLHVFIFRIHDFNSLGWNYNKFARKLDM